MRNFFYRLMAGRNGSDELARYSVYAGLVFLIISYFFKGYMKSIFWWAAVILLIYSYFRIFSKNIGKRYQENMSFVRKKNRIFSKFKSRKEMFEQRKEFNFYKCPNCGIMNRVPRGKGKIQITCPKCKTKFIKET